MFKHIFIPPEALKQKLPTYSKKDEKTFEVISAISENSLIKNIRGRRRKIPFHEGNISIFLLLYYIKKIKCFIICYVLYTSGSISVFVIRSFALHLFPQFNCCYEVKFPNWIHSYSIISIFQRSLIQKFSTYSI